MAFGHNKNLEGSNLPFRKQLDAFTSFFRSIDFINFIHEPKNVPFYLRLWVIAGRQIERVTPAFDIIES